MQFIVMLHWYQPRSCSCEMISASSRKKDVACVNSKGCFFIA